jgi:hypothetical protein
MPGLIRITLTAPPYHTTVKGTDERLCCIQAENVYRAWLQQGYAVAAHVSCTDAKAQGRIRYYMKDVLREITHDLLIAGDSTHDETSQAQNISRGTH